MPARRDARTPGHDAEAERALLGSAILSPYNAEILVEKLKPADFEEGFARTLYHAIRDVVEAGDEVSPGVVLDALGPDASGGFGVDLSDLEEIAATSPTSSDPSLFDRLVVKVRRLSARRVYVDILRRAASFDPTTATPLERDATAALLREAGERLGAMLAGGEFDSLRVLDIAAAARGEGLQAIPWILGGWLAQADFTMCGGEGASGKSWLALDLVVTLAGGGTWLKYYELLVPNGLRVLYIDEEQNERLNAWRINRYVSSGAISAERMAELPIRWLCDNGINLDDEASYLRVCEEVERFRPSWIVVDSLVRVHSRNENANAEMSAFFKRRLRPLAKLGAPDCGLVVLHHLAKTSNAKDADNSASRRLRGASDIRNMVDQLWLLEERADGARVLTHDKCRWGRTSPAIKFEIEDNRGGKGTRLVYLGRADSSREVALTMLRLATFEGVPRSAIVDRLKKEDEATAQKSATRALAELYAERAVAKRKEGREVRYWLTEYGPGDAE